MGGPSLSPGYNECLKKGKIVVFTRGRALAPKELDSAAFDLKRAQVTYQEGDYKWATIQLYYSMFHTARSLLYSRNLRERSHYCLAEAINHLFIRTRLIPSDLSDSFREARNLREEADYYSRWSKSGCERLLRSAEEFLNKAMEIVIPAL